VQESVVVTCVLLCVALQATNPATSAHSHTR
jgi:hypothetical protein